MFSLLVLTIVLVLLNGFFVAAEFAIVKVRASQLETKARQGNRSAVMAKHIASHLDGYLAATQLGITLASLGLGWIGEPVVSKMIVALMYKVGFAVSEDTAHAIALPLAFAIITVLHIVFGELAPKSIAIQRSKSTTLAIAYPLQFFYVVFRPFIWILNGIANRLLRFIGISPVQGSEVHSSEEMKYLVKQSQESGTIESAEHDLIISAFEFSDRTVKQILVPRVKVAAIDIDDFNETQIEKIIEEGYSRYPVYKESTDHITGIVYTRDVLLKLRRNEPVILKDIMRQALFIPETMHIGQLLKEFQRKRQQLAIIVDEYGTMQGIATMEDILEELVGEIQDEYDEEQSTVQQKDEYTFVVQAQDSLLTINQWLPHPIKLSNEYTTLAGAIINKAKRIPEVGEQVWLAGYAITILNKEGNSIVTAEVRKAEGGESTSSELP